MSANEKPVRTVRRTILAIMHTPVPVTTRALVWEASSKVNERHVHRVERAIPGAGVKNAGEIYLIDIEITGYGVSRNDLTKFVRRYLPECEYHYITE